MFTCVKKMSVRIFFGKNYSWVKKNSRQKKSALVKKLSFFADFFCSDKIPTAAILQ